MLFLWAFLSSFKLDIVKVLFVFWFVFVSLYNWSSLSLQSMPLSPNTLSFCNYWWCPLFPLFQPSHFSFFFWIFLSSLAFIRDGVTLNSFLSSLVFHTCWWWHHIKLYLLSPFSFISHTYNDGIVSPFYFVSLNFIIYYICNDGIMSPFYFLFQLSHLSFLLFLSFFGPAMMVLHPLSTFLYFLSFIFRTC